MFIGRHPQTLYCFLPPPTILWSSGHHLPTAFGFHHTDLVPLEVEDLRSMAQFGAWKDEQSWQEDGTVDGRDGQTKQEQVRRTVGKSSPD